VNLLVDGVPVFSAINTQGTEQATQVWQQFAYQSAFASLSDAVTFTFLSGDPSSDFSSGFDNVVIGTVDASTVPLPGTIVLLRSGLGVFGIFSRRRRRAIGHLKRNAFKNSARA